MRTKTERLHNQKRYYQKIKKIYYSTWYDPENFNFPIWKKYYKLNGKYEIRIVARRIYWKKFDLNVWIKQRISARKRCSCSGCGNPRRHVYSSEDRYTRQEKLNNIRFKEQLKELYE